MYSRDHENVGMSELSLVQYCTKLHMFFIKIYMHTRSIIINHRLGVKLAIPNTCIEYSSMVVLSRQYVLIVFVWRLLMPKPIRAGGSLLIVT